MDQPQRHFTGLDFEAESAFHETDKGKAKRYLIDRTEQTQNGDAIYKRNKKSQTNKRGEVCILQHGQNFGTVITLTNNIKKGELCWMIFTNCS